MQYNPNVIWAHMAVEIADSNIRLQRSGHYPTLDLVGSLQSILPTTSLPCGMTQVKILATTDIVNDDKRIGLQLSVPIYQGGVITSRTGKHVIYSMQSTQTLTSSQRAVVRATKNAYRAVIAGIEQVGAFDQAMISAESALEATQAGFEVGTRTIVDVLIAQQRYFQAQRDNSLARHTYIVDHLRLKAAAGVLAEEDLQKVNAILVP